MSSKQLTASVDDMLSLRMDTCLTLSSSLPSGFSSDSLHVSPSSTAAASSQPVRQKHHLLSSRRQTPVVSDCDYVRRQSRLTAVNIGSNVDTLHRQLATDKSKSVDVNDRDSSLPACQQVVKLPRSRSNITRQKAFYNIERPLSIVRRDSSNCDSDECVDVIS